MMKRLGIILTTVFILASAERVFAQSLSNQIDNAPTIGDGVAAYSLQNYEKAAEIWTVLAENGSVDAAFRLAQLYDLGLGVDYDPQQTAKWLEVAAIAGNVDAQYMLAGMYASGRGIDHDQTKSNEYYTKAAELGHARAQYQLGSIYYMGQGERADKLTAIFWFSKAKDGLKIGAEKEIASQVYETLLAELSDEQKLELFKQLAFSNNSSK